MTLKKYKDKFNSKGYNMTYITIVGIWSLPIEWTQNITNTTSWGLNLAYWVDLKRYLYYKLRFEPYLLSGPKSFKIHYFRRSLYYFISFKTIRKKNSHRIILFHRFFYPIDKDLGSSLFLLINFDQCIYFDIQQLIQ